MHTLQHAATRGGSGAAAARKRQMITPAPAGLEVDGDVMPGAGSLPGGGGGGSHAAPSHVLVARALGPVAGRAIIAERRHLLEKVDAADARVRAIEEELEGARGLLPASKAREHAAEAREERLRAERDAAQDGAEAARQETARVRHDLEAERLRAERAEATLEEVRRQFAAELSALREQLEATTADWRCAENEARGVERALAVAQAELRAAEDRVLLSEARCTDEVAKVEAKLNDALLRHDEVESQRDEAREGRAALEGELKALEQRVREAQEPIREERATLRQAISAAEARATLAVGQLAVVERDRSAARQELAALRLEHEAAAEAAAAREGRLALEAAASKSLARDMTDRCDAAERQSGAASVLLQGAMRATDESAATAERIDGLLAHERRRADAADGARQQADRERYLALHAPARLGLAAPDAVIESTAAIQRASPRPKRRARRTARRRGLRSRQQEARRSNGRRRRWLPPRPRAAPWVQEHRSRTGGSSSSLRRWRHKCTLVVGSCRHHSVLLHHLHAQPAPQ